MKFEELFSTLNALNVNDKTEKRSNGKKDLTYLSWNWAIAEFTKAVPDFDYEIKMFTNEHGVSLPYMYDENTGYMVMTSVTALGKTKTMWLPVMDGANNAMKNKPYQYKTKYDVKTVEAATMFDINKTIMRCLTKNLAMFGLGLYIYAGEDLPEDESKAPQKTEPKSEPKVEQKPVAKPEEAPVIGVRQDSEEDLAKMANYKALCEISDKATVNNMLLEMGISSWRGVNALVFNMIKDKLHAEAVDNPQG